MHVYGSLFTIIGLSLERVQLEEGLNVVVGFILFLLNLLLVNTQQSWVDHMSDLSLTYSQLLIEEFISFGVRRVIFDDRTARLCLADITPDHSGGSILALVLPWAQLDERFGKDRFLKPGLTKKVFVVVDKKCQVAQPLKDKACIFHNEPIERSFWAIW